MPDTRMVPVEINAQELGEILAAYDRDQNHLYSLRRQARAVANRSVIDARIRGVDERYRVLDVIFTRLTDVPS